MADEARPFALASNARPSVISVMIIADGRLLADDSPQGLIERSRYHNAVSLVTDEAEKVASALSELPEVAKAEIREGELTVFPAGEANLFEG